MYGIVEVINLDTGEVLHRDSNLLVDGAAITIADAWTVSPSLKSIASVSSILDASNYTIQAISFSKDTEAFSLNAHNFNPSSQVIVQHKDGNAIVTIKTNAGATSSYIPAFTQLPSYPTPMDTQLEDNTNISGASTISIAGSSVAFTLSSILSGNGQNLNVIPYRTSVLGQYSKLAGFYGVYPEGSAVGGTQFFTISNVTAIDVAASTVTTYFSSGILVSLFNSLGSMDTSGYVTKHSENNSSNGILISSAISGFSSIGGEIMYIIDVSGGKSDGAAMALYGGLFALGLHTIDIKRSIQGGNLPPYGFTPLNNPRKYRLFAKKSFSQNILFHADKPPLGQLPGLLNFPNIRIIWRIGFN